MPRALYFCLTFSFSEGCKVLYRIGLYGSTVASYSSVLTGDCYSFPEFVRCVKRSLIFKDTILEGTENPSTPSLSTRHKPKRLRRSKSLSIDTEYTLDITYLSVMLYIKLLLVNILPFSPHSSRGGSSRDVQLLLSYYISFLIVTGAMGRRREGGWNRKASICSWIAYR